MQSAMGGRTGRHREIDVAQISKSRAKCLPGARRQYKCVCVCVCGFFYAFLASTEQSDAAVVGCRGTGVGKQVREFIKVFIYQLMHNRIALKEY